ncbi:MAG: nucleotidyltransferase family protein [Deltaproteobacteria bacterium]|nr:nucleotidyltransferase family protein [Deltaproteobacteria bacterium]
MVTWHDMIGFIRCISRSHLTQDDRDNLLHFADQDVPWDHIVVLADWDGAAGFVYYNMKRLDLLHLFPEPALVELKDIYTHTRKRSLAILSEAEALSLALERAGIQAVALQGLSLITTVYKEPGLRQLGDMDLMIRPDHKHGLKEILWQAGYLAPDKRYPDLLYKEEVWVDIHTHILNLDRIGSRRYLFPEDLSRLWERAVPFFEQSPGLLALDPFDNLIALAAHALKHSYSRMIWLVDIHESLLKWASGPDGWEIVVKRSQSWSQERILLYALILLERTFGLKIPYRVKYELGIDSLSILEKHLLSLSLRGFKSRELCYALWLCNIKGAGNKIKFIKETVFPRDEIMDQIFDHGSGHIKVASCARRFGKAITVMGKGLYQALRLSFRSTGNE